MRSPGQNGGARPGAGRKPRPVEEDVKGAIDSALQKNPGALEDIWLKVIDKAKDGDVRFTQILFNYYYGKPRENEGNPQEFAITLRFKDAE